MELIAEFNDIMTASCSGSGAEGEEGMGGAKWVEGRVCWTLGVGGEWGVSRRGRKEKEKRERKEKKRKEKRK